MSYDSFDDDDVEVEVDDANVGHRSNVKNVTNNKIDGATQQEILLLREINHTLKLEADHHRREIQSLTSSNSTLTTQITELHTQRHEYDTVSRKSVENGSTKTRVELLDEVASVSARGMYLETVRDELSLQLQQSQESENISKIAISRLDTLMKEMQDKLMDAEKMKDFSSQLVHDLSSSQGKLLLLQEEIACCRNEKRYMEQQLSESRDSAALCEKEMIRSRSVGLEKEHRYIIELDEIKAKYQHLVSANALLVSEC